MRNEWYSGKFTKSIKAGLIHVITTELTNGHLYVELNDLKSKVSTLLEKELIEIESQTKLALHDLYASEKIKLVSNAAHHYCHLVFVLFF